MSVSDFFTSMADKAQSATRSAINNNPTLSQHIPASFTGAPHPPHGAPSAPTDSRKNITLEQIQHQFRQLQLNYSSAGPLQKIITAEKGVALDFESVSRDTQSQSKEIYHWGQQEKPDVKDVSDRLAFLTYTAGSLASTLSRKLNTARLPLKELRDNEAALAQKHNIRAGLELQVSRVESGQEKGYEKRLAELKEQLAKAQNEDETAEKQHDILLRKALKESELQKFQALREYGEKLALIAQAAESVLTVLPSIPPSSSQPYDSVEKTGSIRASLQHALDNWSPGQITLSAPAQATLNRSNTGSFGETHAAELQQIDTAHQGILQPATSVPVLNSPPASSQTLPGSSINPAVLNNEPAPIPAASPSTAVKLPESAGSEAKVPVVTPTVAETGIPVSGGSGGPGPSSGSLLDIRSPSSASDATNTLAPQGGSAKQYESAEEEKKRLEREERERLLRSDAGPSDPPVEAQADDGETPPPYQDI